MNADSEEMTSEVAAENAALIMQAVEAGINAGGSIILLFEAQKKEFVKSMQALRKRPTYDNKVRMKTAAIVLADEGRLLRMRWN